MRLLVRAAVLTVALAVSPSVAPFALAQPDFASMRVDRGGVASVQKLYQDLRGKGLDVLLIDIREDPEQVRRTVKERGYVTPVLLDQSGDVAGPGYRVWGRPTVFIVDRQGRLVGRAAGARGWDSQKGRQFMEALLAQTATPYRFAGRFANFGTPMLRCYSTNVATSKGLTGCRRPSARDV